MHCKSKNTRFNLAKIGLCNTCIAVMDLVIKVHLFDMCKLIRHTILKALRDEEKFWVGDI